MKILRQQDRALVINPKPDQSHLLTEPEFIASRQRMVRWRETLNIQKTRVQVFLPGWDQEKPRPFFSQPYSLAGGIAWILNNLLGPSNRHQELTKSIPSPVSLNPIAAHVMKLAFVGDILPLYQTRLKIDQRLLAFFSDVDLVTGNFEGTIVPPGEPGVFMAQPHSEAVLDFLAELFPPERTILSCSNNHSGDYGWKRFCYSCGVLEKHGFITFGRRDEPSITINNQINIATLTCWSNQKCDYVSKFEDMEMAYHPELPFNILYLHWGNEMARFPHPDQIHLGQELLKKWNLIIGHHSHCPQPVAAYDAGDQKRLIAYSLGDFTFGKNMRKYLNGLVVKAQIGLDANGRWQVGDVEWLSTSVDFLSPQDAVLR